METIVAGCCESVKLALFFCMQGEICVVVELILLLSKQICEIAKSIGLGEIDVKGI